MRLLYPLLHDPDEADTSKTLKKGKKNIFTKRALYRVLSISQRLASYEDLGQDLSDNDG